MRRILAALRHRTFYSLAELNVAILELLILLNRRIMRRIGRSRLELFESLDRPAALPLAATRYEFATWAKGTVRLDYHLLVDHHHYSVPYQLIGQSVEIRLSAKTVEIFVTGQRVASHIRSYVRGGTTTVAAHMAPSHRYFAGLNIDTARIWAESIGPATRQLFENIWNKHHGSPSALNTFRGIYRLASVFEKPRIEKAAARAILYGNCTLTSLKRILSSGLDLNENKRGSERTLPDHENVRGSLFYSEETSICSTNKRLQN